MAKAIGNANKKTNVVTQKYLCPYCETEKVKKDFYNSSDPMVKTGITSMCKECAQKMARNYDERTGDYGDCTRQSIQDTLERLDKPFIESVWISATTELNTSSGKIGKDLWSIYIRLISSPQYKMLRWRDGDLYDVFKNEDVSDNELMEAEISRNQQIRE